MQGSKGPGEERPLERASTPALAAELAAQAKELVQKEIELAKAEARSDVRTEIAAAKRLGFAVVSGLIVLNLVLVAVVLALALVWPGWLAALVVAAVVGIAGGIVGWMGWAGRVKQPLPRTKRTVEEDVQWAKERFA